MNKLLLPECLIS